MPNGVIRLGDSNCLFRSISIGNGATFNTNGNDCEFSGDVIINSGGVLNGGDGAITVTGDWSNSGIFTSGSGTVIFVDSGTSTISGNNTFHNFKCESPGKILVFEEGAIQTINGILTLKGSGETLLILKSSNSGSWGINPKGSVSVDYVDVSKSVNMGADIIIDNGSCSGCIGWKTMASLMSGTDDKARNDKDTDTIPERLEWLKNFHLDKDFKRASVIDIDIQRVLEEEELVEPELENTKDGAVVKVVRETKVMRETRENFLKKHAAKLYQEGIIDPKINSTNSAAGRMQVPIVKNQTFINKFSFGLI